MNKQRTAVYQSTKNAHQRVNVRLLQQDVKQLQFEYKRLCRLVDAVRSQGEKVQSLQSIMNKDFDERLLQLEQSKRGRFLTWLFGLLSR